MAISKIVTNSVDSGVTITSPTLVTPALGTPASGVLTNCTGVAKAALPAGCVIQVVGATYATQVTTSSGAYVSIGLSASITPLSTSSRVVVAISVNGIFLGPTASSYTNIRCLRNGAQINLFGYAIGYNSAAVIRGTSSSTNFVDSPASISALTYSVEGISVGGVTVDFQRDSTGVSSIVLMEIAG